MAQRTGFEPADACTSHDFQSCSFDHSDISAYNIYKMDISIIISHVIINFNQYLNFHFDFNLFGI